MNQNTVVVPTNNVEGNITVQCGWCGYEGMIDSSGNLF